LKASSTPKSIALADVNGDGLLDIVFTNTSYPICCTYEGSTVSVFLNRGHGRFSERNDFFAGGNPFSLVVRDIDGDGKVDLVTANLIDASGEQLAYLNGVHELGMSGRQAKLLMLALLGCAGLVGGFFGWRRARWRGLMCAAVPLAIVAGLAFDASRSRTAGESHISILRGR
jgi:hypothetical protein